MKRIATMVAAIALALSAMMSACAGETTAKALFNIDPLPKMTKLRLAYFSGTVHALSNYIAQEKGWFKDAGLDVEFVPFINGPAIMEAKVSWDVGTTGAPGLISGVVGQDVKMIGIGVWDNVLDLFVRPGNPIYAAGKGHIPGYPDIYGKPENWKGTQWLLPAGTTMHLVLLSTLGRMGLTEKDVKISNMEITSAFTAFKAGQGDGLGAWSALAVMAAENGNLRVSGVQECGEKLVTTVFANPSALSANRDAVKKYLEVYLATAHWLDTHRDEGAELYVKTCEEDGIATSAPVAKVTIERHWTATMGEQIAFAEKKVPDPKNPARQITELENLIINTFDFFASQGRYESKDREKMLSGFIDGSLLLELKADYQKAGKKIQ